MASEEGDSVDLYIYDLTNGLATVLSPALIDSQPLLIGDSPQAELGQRLEGVWHTSVVVFEREYFFGGGGITSCPPGGTQLGAPLRVERMGRTFVPFQVFVDYIQGLATSTYTPESYRLLEHNCNHFSDEICQFLCGAHVPKSILLQPDVLPPPLRLALAALLDNLVPDARQAVYANGVRHSRRDSPDFTTLNTQIEEARVASAELGARRGALADKLARKQRRKEKKRAKAAASAAGGGDAPHDASDESDQGGTMAEAVQAAPAAEVAVAAGPSARDPDDADTRHQQELQRRQQDPPIVYRDIDGAAEVDKLSAALGEGCAELDEDARQGLDELRQYLALGEGSWVLGDDFLLFIGRILSGTWGTAPIVPTWRCLCAMALRDDISLLLHQDRRHHALLNHAHRIDRLPVEEQLAITYFMCNLFENISSSEWLLYISEWEHEGQALSNIRTTTKVCVHATLGAEELREAGTALLYNIAAKERLQHGKALRGLLPKHAKSKVFDEVCVELAMAALQLLQWAPAEEHLFRATRALARLARHCADVPQLVALVGPDPAAFRGTSARVDEQIDLIAKTIK